MYTLSKGPFKIIAKTRRGLHAQKLDTLESQRDSASKKSGDLSITADMSTPKPVFQQVNGRRSHSQKNHQDIITPQHEEIIKYIEESWSIVSRELETTKPSAEGKVPNVVYYEDKSTNQLSNFQPFDLESFWGERLLQNITQNT